MSCSTCKHWEFPTLSIHQSMATKGVCSRQAIKDGTGPDDKCDRYVFEEKSAEFKKAAHNASQAGGLKKMANVMNKEPIRSGFPRNQECLSPQDGAALEELRKSIDEIATATPPAQFGDKLYVQYKEPMEYVALNEQSGEAVFKKPDGKLLIVGVNECHIRKPN